MHDRKTNQEPHFVEGALPILKWAGGKQRLLQQYAPHFPPAPRERFYFEPFIGSAAMFFHLQPAQATLSDQNEKLIDLYRAVQHDVEAVISALLPHRNEADYYYDIRAQHPGRLSMAERAARLIYLNKTCYNGLYRENRKGEFNVPFGRYRNPTICDRQRLRTAASALQRAELITADFADVAHKAVAGDFIYFDPPYVPLNATSSFTAYDRRGFTENDHRRLAETIHQLTDKGCYVMLSNSSAEFVFTLYQGRNYRLLPISARRNINSKADRRGPVTELLILNYGPDGQLSRPAG